MRVTTFPTVAAFLDAVRPVLAEREAEHHLVLGVAEAFASAPPAETPPFAAVVEDEGELVLAAWLESAHPLLLASDRESVAPAASALARTLGDRGVVPRRVIGAVGQVETFVEAWEQRTRQSSRVAMRQRVYRLDVVEPLPEIAGVLRVATADDLELVALWMRAFEAEALGPLASRAVRAAAERRVSAGEIHLWCDAEPRAMAGSARPTRHGIAVNAVYTPREWRGRGYATACVAALSRRLLAAGFDFCVLYTDLANPTSNAIYTRIGYRPVRDFLMYEFLSPQRV